MFMDSKISDPVQYKQLLTLEVDGSACTRGEAGGVDAARDNLLAAFVEEGSDKHLFQ